MSATSLGFANQPVAATSAVQRITVSNTGTGNLVVASATVGGANAADYVSSGDTCTNATVAPGATCSVGVAFRPAANGLRTATITVTDNDNNVAGSRQSVTLSGTGTSPIASPSTAALSFGDQRVGTNAIQRVTVTNTGNSPLSIATAAIGGSASGAISKTTDTCTNATLAASASCSVDVGFKPTAPGAETATLTLTDNSRNTTGSTQAVTVTGRGLAPAATLSATSVNFGSQRVRSTSAGRAVTITNTGTAPLAISGVSVSGTNASDFGVSGCGAGTTLAVNASCTLSVTFTPGFFGTRSAAILISDDAFNNPSQSVSLTGSGSFI
jgi:hypothetical protein